MFMFSIQCTKTLSIQCLKSI